MAGRLAAVPEESMDCSMAAVPEESMDCSTAAYPPRSLYRDSIRRVAVSGRQIRSPLFSHSQSGQSGSSYSSGSGTSNSYPSNNSGYSSASALSAAAADFGTNELKMIARQMVSDGYTQRMVQAFEYGGDPDRALQNQFLELHVAPPEPAARVGPNSVLESWFLELDVAWVLQIRQEHGSQWQLPLQDNSGSSLRDLVDRWIRGFTVIVHSMTELVSNRHEMTPAARLGQASIFKMLVFLDAVDVPALKAENLRTVLDMYICFRRAVDTVENSIVCLELAQLSLMPALFVYVDMLKGAIPSTMEKVQTRIEDDDSWVIEVPRGGGEVHRNIMWFADCFVSLDEVDIRGSHYDLVNYLKDLLQRKSGLCSDPSLRYLFLLNNSYFVREAMEVCIPRNGWRPSFGYQSYMDSYLDVSWGDVLSCIPKSYFPGPLHRWIKTTSLAKFKLTFNKTYQAQKFWKVPDPQLRDNLRGAITWRVVSPYRDYLKEHPELAEHVCRGNNTPEVLEEMLGQLFEG